MFSPPRAAAVVIFIVLVVLKQTAAAADSGLPGTSPLHLGGRPLRGLPGLATPPYPDAAPLYHNGESVVCADCHMPSDSFQLSPASAEARFQLAQSRHSSDPKADDPLFQPIDADDFRTNGANANDFSNLRQNGLVRITFTLPSNMKLIDPVTNQPSTETFVDVWRMVPSVFNVKLTGPDGQNAWPRGPKFGLPGDTYVDTLLGSVRDRPDWISREVTVTAAPTLR